MRIKEIMERVDNPTYDPEAGFLRNVGRAGLDQFVRGQLGISAYDSEQEEKRRGERAQRQQQQADRAERQRGEQDVAHEIGQAEIPDRLRTEPATQTVATTPPASIVQQPAAANYAQTNRVKYGATTTNAPAATVPAVGTYTPPVNPAAPPEIYYLDNQPLNPNNPIHARLIAQMQQQGITQARSGTPKR
jgi:hypothetical protein